MNAHVRGAGAWAGPTMTRRSQCGPAGASGGVLTCLKFPTGEVAWSAKEPDLRLNYGGSLVRVGDKMILLSARGRLSLVRATPAGYSSLGRAQLLEGSEIYATLLLYAGRHYVKGMRELVCLDVSSGE